MTRRIGVIGSGAIARSHLAYLNKKNSDAEIYLCDRNIDAATFTSRLFSVKEIFLSTAELLKNAQPEVVHVLTPPATHFEIAMESLHAGCHVIVEKPICLNRGELQRLLELARPRNLRVIEVQNYLYNRPLPTLKQSQAGGGVSRQARHLSLEWSLDASMHPLWSAEHFRHPAQQLPGGLIADFLPHLCYLAQSMIPGLTLKSALWDLSETSGSQFRSLLCLLNNPSGQSVTFRISLAESPEFFRGSLHAPNEKCEFEFFNGYFNVSRASASKISTTLRLLRGAKDSTVAALQNLWNKVMNPSSLDGLEIFLDLAYASLQTGSSPALGEESLASSHELFLQILESRPR